MLSRRRSGYLRCCGIKLIMPSGIRHVAGQRGSQGPRMTPGERRGLHSEVHSPGNQPLPSPSTVHLVSSASHWTMNSTGVRDKQRPLGGTKGSPPCRWRRERQTGRVWPVHRARCCLRRLHESLALKRYV